MMARPYYNGAVGAVIVFDFARPSSLATAIRWKKDIDSRAVSYTGDSLPCILVGNKVHKCRAEEWDKTDEEMDLFVTANGFLNFLGIRELNCKTLDRCVSCLLKHIGGCGVKTKEMLRRPHGHEKCW
jgi:GTPase SAR1 family protein